MDRDTTASGAPGRRALVVEDEVDLAAVVAGYLGSGGFEVSVVHDGLSAVAMAREVDPDVVVLDLGLPQLDGVEVCRQLRTFSDAYVVMLTARSDEVDTLIGLSVGADDYVTKPFSPRVLLARIQAMLRRPRPIGHHDATRRSPGTPRRRWEFGDLTIDLDGREVTLAGHPVALTRIEFDLLAALADQPHLAYSRQQLIDRVWGPAWVGDEHLVDVHVGHLRKKLDDDPARARFVRTIRGVGYRMGTGSDA